MTTAIEYPPGPSYKMRPAKLVREFLHDPIKTLQSISRKYGNKVLVYDHRNFTKGKRLQLAKALLGEGLVTSEGILHNRQDDLFNGHIQNQHSSETFVML
ncbi:MAG TPA: hypothetical protein VFI70_08750 [Nitrososphaeraceae archaeon]|nr:hypothetical protein [Nitrososphaeraceae archaeon]